MKKPLVGIINISINNILSIKRALDFIGFDTVVINENQKIDHLDMIVLPGVGTFNSAMKTLQKTGLIKTINKALDKDKKFLGICLGMQLLFESSNEFGKTNGIGFFDGEIESFETHAVYKKTFIGWNKVKLKENTFDDDKKLSLLQNKPYYFVHSFFANCKSKDIIFGTSSNGDLNFASIVKKNNVIAFQFHPEKSGENGLQLLKIATKEILE
jgi:imidazole glycerol-phosphate synthase subunit HisH